MLTHRPLSAIHWFALGLHTLKQGDDFIFMDYSEKCFKMAAHNSPISRTYWYNLFAIRDQLGRDSDAKNAYLFYFKLLEKNERLKRKSEAMDVLELNEKDFEELFYHQHIPTNFNKNYFRKI